MKYFFLLFFIGMVCPFTYAQHKPGKEHHVRKAIDQIVVDGVLDERSWEGASVGTGFFMNRPYDSVPPTYQTFFRITFDDNFLYAAYECESDGRPPMVQSLRRDFDFQFTENMGIYFDPFNDFTNGFYFNVSPYAVQREGLMSGGGNSPFDYSSFWDNKWYSATKRYENRWVAEIAIPLKSIRYNRESWNFNIIHNDAGRNEVSSWIATPYQYFPSAFAFSGKLIWDDPLPKPGLNVSLIPYLAGTVSRDKETDLSENSFSGGFDAKLGLTPSLNLDLTLNPDFSQVEVDRQVINLTRFEFQFPELRQFFLENNDLFAQMGFPDARPFFSRRIGLARDTTGILRRVSILYGARVSGKIGKNWRIGAMNLQTRKKESLGLPDQNYTVAVVQRQILSRSNIGLMMVNKQSLDLGEYDDTRFYHASVLREVVVNKDTVTRLNKFNRVLGADMNLLSKDSKLRGNFYYHRSLDAFAEDKNYSYGFFLGYFTRYLDIMGSQQGMGKNYNAEVGFVPGLTVYPGFDNGFVRASGKFYPKSKTIAVMGPSAEARYTRIPTGETTDTNFKVDYGVEFVNTSAVRAAVEHSSQLLTIDFNPISSSYRNYLEGEEHSWTTGSLEYRSDQRKLFNYSLRTGFGGFYNGSIFNVNGQLNYRVQPYGVLTALFDYNDINLPGDYGSQRLFLIGPRLDLTFTDKLFLTTFVQFNNKDDNINLNTRFQWRFKPASDFFVVYTENYLPSGLVSKNRALVLKLTYWFNL